jgi:desulfoferrodoxin-like iron-binding protein
MKGHICKVCKYIAIDGAAPEQCPVCGAAKTAFSENENAINMPKDPDNPTDLEKKHIPVIDISKTCDIISDGCYDIHAHMGEIKHPMESAHYIMHIDFYIDRNFIARAHLSPEKLNPAAGLHLKPLQGKLEVVELCNLHGAWFNEADIR